jgi:hypothetical protein
MMRRDNFAPLVCTILEEEGYGNHNITKTVVTL